MDEFRGVKRERAPSGRNIGEQASLLAVCALILLVILPPAAAATGPADGWNASLGMALTDFSYKEFGDNGALLDREDGTILGVEARAFYRWRTWALSGGASKYAADVAYDGHTNTGIPVTTRSNADITDLYLRAELRSSFSVSWDSAFYAGIGYTRWARDIQPTATASGTPVRGLFEIYEWTRLLLGTYVAIGDWGDGRWSVDAQAFRTSNSKVHVDFQGTFDNVTLPLGDAWGGRVALRWSRALSATTGFTAESYLSTWKHGRSATHPLTRNGTEVGTVNEPRSTTRSIGIIASLWMHF